MYFWPLYYFNHESGYSIISNTQDPFALTSIPSNREDSLWIRWNNDEMDVIGSLGNSVHSIDGVEFYDFYFSLGDVDTWNEVLLIKIGWMHSELHHPLMMSQCKQSTYNYITDLSFKWVNSH